MGLFDSNAGVKLRGILKGLLAGISADDENLACALMMGLGPLATYSKAAVDSMAADATANTTVMGPVHNLAIFPNGSTTRTIRCIGGRILALNTLTSHDTNYADINFTTRTAAGASAAVCATASTTTAGTGSSTGSWAQYGVYSVPPVSSSAAIIPAGGGLFIGIAKQGSGVLVPASFYSVYGIPEA